MTSPSETYRPPATTLRASPATDVSVLGLLALLLRERKTVLVSTVLAVAVGFTMAVLRPRTYTASFSFVPQSQQDPARNGLASLAGQFGIALGGAAGGVAQSPQLYADLLKTRGVLLPIAVDSFSLTGAGVRVPLSHILRTTAADPTLSLDKTLRALRTRVISTSVAARTTGVVSATIRTPSPTLSVEIAERVLRGVNQFNLTTRQTQAGEERRFTEKRLDTARMSLRVAEGVLERFLRTNREFGGSPQLTFERDRLQRDVAFHQEIVTSLAQQYEEARIREVRDIPVITVIEQPAIPAQPDPRGRVMLVVTATVIGAGAGVLIALARDAAGRLRSVGHDAGLNSLINEWRRLRKQPT